MPVTGHNGELRVKQEAQADFAAMSRDHITEEDIETFTHVQELAVQVRNWGKGSTSSEFSAYVSSKTLFVLIFSS